MIHKDSRSSFRRWGSHGAPAFVMLHSLGLDSDSFRWLADAMLALADVQIIAPDLRGHGVSKAEPHEITLANIAGDVVDLVQSLGLERVHLLGTSMGSAIARLAVSQRPGLWRAVTLVAGGPAAVPALAQRGDAALAGGMKAIVESTLQRWFVPAALEQEDEFVRYARDTLLCMEPSAWAASWQALAGYPDPGALPAAVRGLCIAGELDASATAQIVDAMRAAAGASVPVVVVPGGAHQLTMTHASTVADVLISSVDQRYAR